jgi:hypothetical protein
MRVNHANGDGFSWIRSVVLSMVCLLATTSSGYAAVFMSATNETINAGKTGTVTVTWTSTQAINYLQTEFILTAVTGPSAGLSFTSPPVLPTWTGNYVFAGDSFAENFYTTTINASNPASVSMTNWTDDTYNYNDETLSGNNAAQDGTRFWLVLNLTAAAGVSGTYQLTFGSSEFDYVGSTGATALSSSNLSGGLITINGGGGGGGGGAVPEPCTAVIGGMMLMGMALRHRETRMRVRC